jgi:hypothetical protein
MGIEIECPQCGRRYTVPDNAAGKAAKCRACGAQIDVPADPAGGPAPDEGVRHPSAPLPSGRLEQTIANRQIAVKTCTLCGRPIMLGERVRNCDACRHSFHETCWQTHGGCGTQGCSRAPAPAPTAAPGPSFGPRPPDTKPCPFCGERIAASAVKCRHCGEFLSRPGGAPGAAAARGPTQASGKAIGAMVCGICSFFLCCYGIPLSIVAVALGSSARRSIARSRGRLTGDGMARAGVILGTVHLVLSVLFILFVAIMSAMENT